MVQVLEESVREALRSVVDPEIPSVNIVDLGLVEHVRVDPDGTARIDLLPTFTGCPALGIIRQAVLRRVESVPGISRVEVDFLLTPSWSTDRISPAGRIALQSFAVAPPGDAPPTCPFCGSSQTRLDSAFGPTRCRSVFYCESCQNPFERMKVV